MQSKNWHPQKYGFAKVANLPDPPSPMDESGRGSSDLGTFRNEGTIFRGPYNKAPTILGSPILGNPHIPTYVGLRVYVGLRSRGVCGCLWGSRA